MGLNTTCAPLWLQDLQDLYQDAAGDILVALWKHFPAEVLAKLLEGFQGQLLPYRSILCVLGKLAMKGMSLSQPPSAPGPPQQSKAPHLQAGHESGPSAGWLRTVPLSGIFLC